MENLEQEKVKIVINFIENLMSYFEGDYKNFIKGCELIEKNEKKLIITGSNSANMQPFDTKGAYNNINNVKTPITHNITNLNNIPPTTTMQTTQAPVNNTEYVKIINYRSTIPHALSIFAVIDFIGFLIGKNKYIKFGTKLNIENFLQEMSINVTEKNILLEFFRHGLVHTYFPKGELSIAAHSKFPLDKIFIKINNKLTLNINALMYQVKETVKKILDDKVKKQQMKIQFDIYTKANEKIKSDPDLIKIQKDAIEYYLN